MGLKKSAELANAERVADEAIAALDVLEDMVRNALLDQGIGEDAEPNLWQQLERSKADAARLRSELEGG
jgi:hypothetical protein